MRDSRRAWWQVANEDGARVIYCAALGDAPRARAGNGPQAVNLAPLFRRGRIRQIGLMFGSQARAACPDERNFKVSEHRAALLARALFGHPVSIYKKKFFTKKIKTK